MATVRIEYYGMEGEGRTLTEAKKDAGRKIQAALGGYYTPELLTWRGETALIYREPNGWRYSLLLSGGKLIDRPYGISSNGPHASKKEALQSAGFSLAQNGWQPADGTEILPDFLDESNRREMRSWATFQLRCIRAKNAGITSSNEIHDYGCGCFTGGEALRQRVEGPVTEAAST